MEPGLWLEERSPAGEALTGQPVLLSSQEPERQYMHIGTMVEFAFALVAKLDAINKHSFNDFKLRVGMSCRDLGSRAGEGTKSQKMSLQLGQGVLRAAGLGCRWEGSWKRSAPQALWCKLEQRRNAHWVEPRFSDRTGRELDFSPTAPSPPARNKPCHAQP